MDIQVIPSASIVLGTTVFLFIAVITFFVALQEEAPRVAIGVVITLMIWGFSEGFTVKPYPVYEKVESKEIVSIGQPHFGTTGGLSSSFVLFSGIIEQSRYYILREEVEPGLYRDLEVKSGAFLREDSSLNDRGIFKTYRKCADYETEYRILGINLKESERRTECQLDRREIVVPSGYIIQELNKI